MWRISNLNVQPCHREGFSKCTFLDLTLSFQQGAADNCWSGDAVVRITGSSRGTQHCPGWPASFRCWSADHIAVSTAATPHASVPLHLHLLF